MVIHGWSSPGPRMDTCWVASSTHIHLFLNLHEIQIHWYGLGFSPAMAKSVCSQTTMTSTKARLTYIVDVYIRIKLIFCCFSFGFCLPILWKWLSLRFLSFLVFWGEGFPKYLADIRCGISLVILLGWHICRAKLTRKTKWSYEIAYEKCSELFLNYFKPLCCGSEKSRRMPANTFPQDFLGKIKNKFTDELLQAHRENILYCVAFVSAFFLQRFCGFGMDKKSSTSLSDFVDVEGWGLSKMLGGRRGKLQEASAYASCHL